MAEEQAKPSELNEPRPLNMSGVQNRTKHMLEPELIFTWDTYMAEATTLAVRRFSEINVAMLRGNGIPSVFALHDIPDQPEDVAAQPSLARGDNTILVRTYPKSGKVRLDMRRFLLMGRFVIPHGHRAYVPIGRKPLVKIGDALIFLFSEARFVPVEPERTRKKKTGGSAEQAKPAPESDKPAGDTASA